MQGGRALLLSTCLSANALDAGASLVRWVGASAVLLSPCFLFGMYRALALSCAIVSLSSIMSTVVNVCPILYCDKLIQWS